jgi:predicted MPP superfamily phosphohydrolase
MRYVWKLALYGLLLVPWSRGEEQAAPRPNDGFYFVQITDTHWGALDGVALTRRAVAAVNGLPVKVEFVVHTGDILADRIRDERIVNDGLDALKGLAAPLFFVPGNHDILRDDHAATARLFEKYFGAMGGRTVVKGVVCLFGSTEWPKDPASTPAQAECDWIEKSLGAQEQRPVLVFQHRPPVRDLLAKTAVPADNEMSHPRWQGLFEEHPQIKALITGHLHRDELHWIGQVPIYVSSALARFWDRQPSFRLYKYEHGRLEYWTLYIERPPSSGTKQNSSRGGGGG